MFYLFLKRDLTLLSRSADGVVQGIAFFFLIAIMFPFSLPIDLALLAEIGAGVIWVSALLATLLSLDSLFKSDYEDGTLEQTVLHASSLELAVLGKVTAHWLGGGFLLSLLSPFLCLAFNIPVDQIWVLFASILLGTPSLYLIGAIGAALTVSLKRGSVIVAIVVLPLFVPILIFGAGVVAQHSQGLPVISELYALAGIFVLCLSLAPFAIATALRSTIGNA